MSSPRIEEHAEVYATRWHFVEIHQGKAAPDRETFERFLRLGQSDVDWIASSTRQHRVGQTWAGLSRLLERDGHERVRDIGMPAAVSWASHLELPTGPSQQPLRGPRS